MANRVALEAELGAGELSFIREWCRRSFADRDAWPAERALASFIDVAISRYMDANRRRSHSRTIEDAAAHFGVSPATIKSRIRRRRQHRIRKDANCTQLPAKSRVDLEV